MVWYYKGFFPRITGRVVRNRHEQLQRDPFSYHLRYCISDHFLHDPSILTWQ
ncbi:hypothetical protein D3C71_2247490 [compost metagenome]